LRYQLEVDEFGGDFSDPVLSKTEIGTEQEFVSLATGDYHTVALKTDGTVWAWGSNGNGQL